MTSRQFESASALLVTAKDRDSADAVSMPVRELISYWHASARGNQIVQRIKRALAREGLTTEPDFASGHIDSYVRVVRVSPDSAPTAETVAAALRLDALQSAQQTVADIAPDATLAQAMTHMALHDYSQLAVASGPRSVKGAVSWESIGRASLARKVDFVRDAMVPVQPVPRDSDLLAVLPNIAEAGFVLVKNVDQSLCGIVTAADVTNEFGALAEPFFLVGEIERRLRLLIARGEFSVEELAEFMLDDGRSPQGPDDLTLGEVCRLLAPPESWERLHWNVDRATFLKSLDDVRVLRNGLMHFSIDVPAPQDVALLRNFLAMLRLGPE